MNQEQKEYIRVSLDKMCELGKRHGREEKELLQDNEDTEVQAEPTLCECYTHKAIDWYCPKHKIGAGILKTKPSSKVEKLKELRSQLNKFPVNKKETWMYEVISLLTDVLIEDEE